MWMKHNDLNTHEQNLLDMSVEEFDDYMMETYPEMFGLRNHKYKDSNGRSILHTMNFGFSIGPGWRHVLDTACRKCAAIKALVGYYPEFDQIKEKFGTARFYFHIEKVEGRSGLCSDQEWCDLIWDIINRAEEYTGYICERLGTNCRIEDQIEYPGWTYGMSIEGFKLWAVEQWGEESGLHRIKMAEDKTRTKKLRTEIKRHLNYLSHEELESINKTIEDLKDSEKHEEK